MSLCFFGFYKMSFADSLTQVFDAAVQKFLTETHFSRAAEQIVICLKSDSKGRYSDKNRNVIVKNLAEDVETALGCSANLIFRTPGPLHNALQDILDEYLNWCDTILYTTNMN